MITIDDFAKVELRVGTVVKANEVEGSDKLIRLEIDLGEESPRQVFTGMKTFHPPEHFQGKQVVIVTNLAPKNIMGMESEGMLLAADGENGPVLLVPETPLPNGAQVR